MTNRNQGIVVALGTIAILVIVILMAAFGGQGKKDVSENHSEWDQLCYVKTLQPGQGISESGPGEYEYTLIMTVNGIDVYVPCDNGTE